MSGERLQDHWSSGFLFQPKSNIRKKRGPKKGSKTKLKVRPSKDVTIENIEMLSKEQVKKVV